MRADLNVIFQDGVADLRNFVMNAVFGSKAEAVTADNGTAVDDVAVTDTTAFVDRHVRIEDRICADLCADTDIRVRIDNGVVADCYVVVKDSVCHDGNVFTEFDIFADNGSRVDTAFDFRTRRERCQELRESRTRVSNTNGRFCERFYVHADDNGTCIRCFCFFQMRGNGKGQMIRACMVDIRQCVDLQFRCVSAYATDHFCDFF